MYHCNKTDTLLGKQYFQSILCQIYFYYVDTYPDSMKLDTGAINAFFSCCSTQALKFTFSSSRRQCLIGSKGCMPFISKPPSQNVSYVL